MPRQSRRTVASVPLGSLTQVSDRDQRRCPACGSTKVISIGMTLADGTPVDFSSCRACEQRTWTGPDGSPVPVDQVLDSSRKR